MPVQLYIILHKTSKPKTYEWSLVPHLAGVPLPGLRPVSHFEITKARRRPHSDYNWVTTVQQRIFHVSHKFLGVLALPPCDESTTLGDIEEIFSQAAPMPWSLSPEDRRRWTCAKWIVDILVEWGPLWGLNFISKFENRDVLLSLLNALSTWLEEDPRHERVSTGDGYEYSCVRCPEFLLRPSNTDIDIRRCLPARPALAPPRAAPAVAEAR